MRLKIFPWLGQEFISLSWEGNGEGTVENEIQEVYARFTDWLGRFGLTLDHTVRTRQFCRDFDTWQAASAARGTHPDGGGPVGQLEPRPASAPGRQGADHGGPYWRCSRRRTASARN